MIDKDIEQFVETLYPFIIKKMQSEGILKNCVRMKNATVAEAASAGDATLMVRFPYETKQVEVRNEIQEALSVNDVVCIMYWVDLKNAIAIFKVQTG